MSVSSRTLGRVFCCLAIAFAIESRPANAAIITQTQTRSFSISSGAQSFSWNQFNPALGTLLSVEYRVDARLTGSFFVINLSTNQNITVRNSTNVFENTFTGAGAPATFLGSVLGPIPTSPVTNATGTVVPFSPSGVSVQTFVVTPSPQTMSVPLTNLTSSAAYFTGLGTVNSSLTQFPDVSVTGSAFGVNMAGLVSAGDATLIYRYDDSPLAVPEPSSLLLAGLGIGTFGLKRLRNRKLARVRSYAS
jgi:hypothetical protein